MHIPPSMTSTASKRHHLNGKPPVGPLHFIWNFMRSRLRLFLVASFFLTIIALFVVLFYTIVLMNNDPEIDKDDLLGHYFPDTIAHTKYLGLWQFQDVRTIAQRRRQDELAPVDSYEKTIALEFHDIHTTNFQKLYPAVIPESLTDEIEEAEEEGSNNGDEEKKKVITKEHHHHKYHHQNKTLVKQQSEFARNLFRTKEKAIKAILENKHCKRTFASRKKHPELWYTLPEDQPRAADEAHFCNIPGKFRDEEKYPLSPEVVSMPPFLKADVDSIDLEVEFKSAVKHLHDMFKLYDDNGEEDELNFVDYYPGLVPSKSDTLEFEKLHHELINKRAGNNPQQQRTLPSLKMYGTMCVGADCAFLPSQFASLKIPIAHFVVVVNTPLTHWKLFFAGLENHFPGRFTALLRPQKLSCAESWNVVTRLGFAHIRPSPSEVFISNADWHPKKYGGIDNHMSKFLEFSATKQHLVLNRFMHFSSFSFTKKGYLELGYFDEVIFPALTEDVEFHLKAVSKGLGELGLYKDATDASFHAVRASSRDKETKKREDRGSRFDNIYRKWGIAVPNFVDFAIAKPFRAPFNLRSMNHTRSWVVDLKHRQCLRSGVGKRYKKPSDKCLYNVNVLKKAGFAPVEANFKNLNVDIDHFDRARR